MSDCLNTVLFQSLFVIRFSNSHRQSKSQQWQIISFLSLSLPYLLSNIEINASLNALRPQICLSKHYKALQMKKLLNYSRVDWCKLLYKFFSPYMCTKIFFYPRLQGSQWRTPCLIKNVSMLVIVTLATCNSVNRILAPFLPVMTLNTVASQRN